MNTLLFRDNNHRNFIAWIRDRIEKKTFGDGKQAGQLTMIHTLERFGKFKIFDDITLQYSNQFDLFLREEETFSTKGKLIIRSDAAIHYYHNCFKVYVYEALKCARIREFMHTIKG